MGGLVILALAAVVAQLHRVVDALAARPALRPGRPMEGFEQPARPAAGARVPFPPKSKAENRETHTAETVTEMAQAAVADALTAAPTLHNPVEPAAELPPPLGANGFGAKTRGVCARYRLARAAAFAAAAPTERPVRKHVACA